MAQFGQNIYQVNPNCYVILENEQGEWLFLLRSNTGYMDDHWSFPGGHVEQHEPIVLAAIREAEEEIGVVIQEADLDLVHVLQRDKRAEGYLDKVDFYFLVHAWSGEPINKEPHLHSEIQWLKPHNLPENTLPFIRSACVSISSSQKIAHQ